MARSSERTKEKIAKAVVKPSYTQGLKFETGEDKMRHFNTFRVIRSFWDTVQYDDKINKIRENPQWAKVCQQEGFYQALESNLGRVARAEDGSI
ncbi:MAG: hypothetical protein WAO86_14625, partial [Lentibacter algarum]